ncbi:NAD-dependent epimerase/dehydratase family protein [Streptomyces rectiviolaceus]|uniref:NAD(P)-dependent oxidoreductase n=1 Tax=Streptomyces rectiviolaceus TaxID=332591 RepID=A0ABP6MRI1_9ACTN
MRVLLAGATGAIGRPLTRALIASGHHVLALSRSEESASAVRGLGAEPVRADALDRDELLGAVAGLRADGVIHQLTSLRKPRRTLDANDPSNLLRTRGTAHLLEAARALGARRFLTQSMVLGHGYADHGSRTFTEDDDFGVKQGNVADFIIDGLRSTEGQVFGSGHLDGIALRYGVFHGPGTWFDPTPGSRPTPVPRDGGGSVPWIHVDDAAAATVAALERGRGGEAYTVVEDLPATWGEVATATAAARGGRAPRLPSWLLRRMVPYLGVLMADTTLRASHAKAVRELGWRPAHHATEYGARPTRTP